MALKKIEIKSKEKAVSSDKKFSAYSGVNTDPHNILDRLAECSELGNFIRGCRFFPKGENVLVICPFKDSKSKSAVNQITAEDLGELASIASSQWADYGICEIVEVENANELLAFDKEIDSYKGQDFGIALGADSIMLGVLNGSSYKLSRYWHVTSSETKA